MQSASGFSSLLKEGHKHFGGEQEAVIKNINACKEISTMTRTSLGPNGMKKMVINHLDKIFVTSDAATIMRELEVAHPAAKMVVMASEMQERECGDMTNFVLTFAGELLEQAEGLIKMGLHPQQIITGYESACKKACEFLKTQSIYQVTDCRNLEQVTPVLRSTLDPKLVGFADFFSKLLAEACIFALPRNVRSFDIEYVRICKLLGSNTFDSFVLQGMVVARQAEGSINRVTNPKICVFGVPLQLEQQDTKGTVLIKNAKELMNYSKSEEEFAEKIVKGVADSGAKVVVVGGTIADICLHYCEKYQIMIIKVLSKFELKRLCKAVGATALTRLGSPTAEELGTADEVLVQEIGSQKVTVFKRETEDCKLSTIVLRGSTHNLLDDIERALDDGCNTFRCLIKNGQFLPGAGAIETLLQNKLEQEANLVKGLDQYSYSKFAKSFQCIPRILIENSGNKVDEALAQLTAFNMQKAGGINVENGEVVDSNTLKVYDHLNSKLWAIKMASDAAVTILRIDQIIVSKPAGGPKPKQNNDWDAM